MSRLYTYYILESWIITCSGEFKCTTVRHQVKVAGTVGVDWQSEGTRPSPLASLPSPRRPMKLRHSLYHSPLHMLCSTSV